MNNIPETIKFSVIIPVQAINDYILETCGKLSQLPDKNFEVIIFPDEIEENNVEMEKKLGVRIIPTGKVSPAIKRDMAIEHAMGEFLAFTDDDAYPNKNWLKIAEKYLLDDSVSAVGGPQLTPPGDFFWQKVSGAVFLSPLSGNAINRYWPGKNICEVYDWPTVNFIIKKSDFEKVGGFDSQYWPGEDTKLCLDLVNQLKKKILYVPELVVYHHRRAGLKKHLKQVGGYGLHRGFFAKEFPETSRKIMYFMPSLLDLFIIIGGIASIFSSAIFKLYLSGLGIYGLAIVISTVVIWTRTKDLLISAMTIPYIMLTHFWYGLRFMQGLVFIKKLNSKLGK